MQIPMIDYEDLILARQEQQEIDEDDGIVYDGPTDYTCNPYIPKEIKCPKCEHHLRGDCKYR